MINFKNVSFAYDQHAVLDKFNLQFVDKKINCIVGPSAVGKTTLLNLIARTIAPTKGTINNVNRNVSYLFQDERLINEITVYKNLELVLKSVFHNENKRRSLIIKGLKSIGMEHTENWYPDQLSGSMKRRLALLRAFLYPSQILLMDEPFTGLDINIKQNIMALFLKLWNKDKRTVVFVSHDLDETLMLSHYIYVMSQKPMHLLDALQVKLPYKKRTLYLKEIIALKKQLIGLTKKW